MENSASCKKPQLFQHMQISCRGGCSSGDGCASAIENLLQEFDLCFADFEAHSDTFQLFADPFSADVESVPSVLQMELIDLQCNSELKINSEMQREKQTRLDNF